MHGFSSHTFSLINAAGARFWVKFHCLTRQGIENNTSAEAIRLAGEDPDHATADLFDAIARGDHPKWRVCVQIMPEVDAETYHLNPFDLTKVWPHKDYPLVEVGSRLNRNPQNYFVEVQAAFSPSNIVEASASPPTRCAGAGPVLPGRPPLPARRQLRIAAGQPTACDGGTHLPP